MDKWWVYYAEDGGNVKVIQILGGTKEEAIETFDAHRKKNYLDWELLKIEKYVNPCMTGEEVNASE